MVGGKLHIGEILVKKGWNVSEGCMLCGSAYECVNYLFFICPFAKSLSSALRTQLKLST